MSSLAHTRAGITDAMYTVGAIEILIDYLNSDNEQVIWDLKSAQWSYYENPFDDSHKK